MLRLLWLALTWLYQLILLHMDLCSGNGNYSAVLCLMNVISHLQLVIIDPNFGSLVIFKYCSAVPHDLAGGSPPPESTR
jgi:hypothetical protein